MNKLLIFLLLFLSLSYSAQGSDKNYAKTTDRIWLDSKEVHQGEYTWKMMKVGDVKASAEEISSLGYNTSKLFMNVRSSRPLFRERCLILLCIIRSILNPITG